MLILKIITSENINFDTIQECNGTEKVCYCMEEFDKTEEKKLNRCQSGFNYFEGKCVEPTKTSSNTTKTSSTTETSSDKTKTSSK